MHSIFLSMSSIVVVFAATVTPAYAIDLSDYRWQSRLLLIFAPSASAPGYSAFNRQLMRQESEVQDRDLVLLRIFRDGISRLEDEPLSPEDAAQLRDRFKSGSDQLSVILIGKDGGVKLVREKRAELQEIFDRIDRMPMRQREMKDKARRR